MSLMHLIMFFTVIGKKYVFFKGNVVKIIFYKIS